MVFCFSVESCKFYFGRYDSDTLVMIRTGEYYKELKVRRRL